MTLIHLILVCVALCAAVVFSQIISADLLCRFGDLKCYQRTTQFLIQNFAATGAPALNLKPFDPLHFDLLKVERNWTSPVSVELTILGGDILGLSGSEVYSVKGLDAQLSENLEIELFTPKIVLRGPYEIHGEVYNVPIVGQGEFEMVLANTFTQGVAITSSLRKADLTYMHVSKVLIMKYPERVRFNLTGLYDDNQELTKRMLAFLNHNGVEVYKQWAPTLERAKAVFFQEIFNDVFHSLPYENFFLHS